MNRLPEVRVSLIALAATAVLSVSGAAAQQDTATKPLELAEAPVCSNNKGEPVQFSNADRGRPGLAAGMAIRDGSGKPAVVRSNYSAAPVEFQQFIDRHECAHHQTGDVDRPHPARNGPEHLMNESISDCVAIRRLRDEEGFGKSSFEKVAEALRADMAKVGFPESSISSRIRNLASCFASSDSAGDLIDQVLHQRGLPRQ